MILSAGRQSYPKRRQATERGAPARVFTGLSLLVLLAIYGIGKSRGQLIAVAVGGLFVCLSACLGVGRLLPSYYAMRLLIVGYALQLMVLVAIAALGLPLSPGYHPFEVNAADAPLRVVLAIVAVPVGTLLAALAWRFVSRQSPAVEKLDPLDAIAKQRRVYLVIAAFAQLLYWPAALESAGVAGYLVRVVVAALMVAPFLAGRDSRGDRSLASLWCLIILVDVVVGIASGSRAKALGVALFFVAGYISALPRGRRLAVGACAVLALVPLLQFAGAMGVVRGELGRGGLELATSDHIRDVFRELSREMTPGGQQNAEAINTHGVGRILVWTNVVVPIMTPETIPYRGLDGFLDEAVESFHIASLSGLTAEDLYDALLFNSPARLYGFTVNSNTSVEFSLAADAWSRGGAPVALLFAFIAGFALMACEACAYRLRRYPTGVGTILALPVVKGALDAAGVPLLSMLRDMVLNLLLVVVGVAVIELTRHAWRKVRRPRVAVPLRSTEVLYRRA
jgi:hypothetical protein